MVVCFIILYSAENVVFFFVVFLVVDAAVFQSSVVHGCVWEQQLIHVYAAAQIGFPE